jgi:hypothetical protein
MLFFDYTISSKANSKATDVIIVAKEVSTGITKFSGFKPLLNVSTATLKDRITIPMTAIMLEIQIINRKSNTVVKAKTWLIANDISAKIVKIRNEATHTLTMFLPWFFIDEKLGESMPNASLVLAVEPTTEPTLLTMLINAG